MRSGEPSPTSAAVPCGHEETSGPLGLRHPLGKRQRRDEPGGGLVGGLSCPRPSPSRNRGRTPGPFGGSVPGPPRLRRPRRPRGLAQSALQTLGLRPPAGRVAVAATAGGPPGGRQIVPVLPWRLLAEQGHQLRGPPRAQRRRAVQQCARQPGVQPQPGHPQPARGRPPGLVHRADRPQYLPRGGHRPGGRRVQEGESRRIGLTPAGGLERERRQVREPDLRGGVRRQPRVLGLRPAAVHRPRCLTPGPPGPLAARRAGRPYGRQGAQTPGVVHPGLAGQPRVHDHPHPRHRQAGLRDRRRQDHPAVRGRLSAPPPGRTPVPGRGAGAPARPRRPAARRPGPSRRRRAGSRARRRNVPSAPVAPPRPRASAAPDPPASRAAAAPAGPGAPTRLPPGTRRPGPPPPARPPAGGPNAAASVVADAATRRSSGRRVARTSRRNAAAVSASRCRS